MEKERKKKEVSRYESGEWSMDFDVDRKTEENPENRANTQLLSSVLDQLLSNPYDVELQRPEFEYHEDDELYMTVRFPVKYKFLIIIFNQINFGWISVKWRINSTKSMFLS